MAATVYTGSGNWSYTNSTGGNVRVLIYYCYNNTSSQDYDAGVKQVINGVDIASATNGTNMAFTGFGRGIVYMSSSNSTGWQVKNIAGNSGGVFVDEFFLADGQSTALEAVNAGKPIKAYNIMVVPEGN
tara:strand:- start:218 stop:604 length:387 start_codon:yes stop_codon:yes gene_type:complete